MIGVRRHISTIALSVALALAVAGCHKKVPAPAPAPPPPPPPAAPAPPPPPPPPPPPAAAPAPRPLSEEEIFARKSVDELNAEKPLDDASSTSTRRSPRGRQPALQKDADWLKKWTQRAVTLEGHCDSRGSAEYNLGLGNRRAATVKAYLVSLGVPAGR